MAKSSIRGLGRLQKKLDGAAKAASAGLMEELLHRVLAKTKELPHLNVGFFEGATYPTESGGTAGDPYPDGTPVAAVAYWNEFGTDRIPARPFMRQTIAKNQDQWGKLLAGCLRQTRGDLDKAMAMAGEQIVSQLQEQIRTLQDPPLAASTMENRLRSTKKNGKLSTVNMATASKPLIDTGHMLNSVGYEVTTGGKD